MAAKNNGKLDIGSDPPVVVGGGGSSLIWVKFGQDETPVPPHGFPPSTPAPTNPGLYSVSKITHTPVRLYFNDGATPGSAGEKALVIENAKTWYIRFDVPGAPPRRKKAKK